MPLHPCTSFFLYPMSYSPVRLDPCTLGPCTVVFFSPVHLNPDLFANPSVFPINATPICVSMDPYKWIFSCMAGQQDHPMNWLLAVQMAEEEIGITTPFRSNSTDKYTLGLMGPAGTSNSVKWSLQMQQYIPVEKWQLMSHHQQGHAAHAFLDSPFDRALVLTIDGGGNDGWGSLFLAQRSPYNMTELVSIDYNIGTGCVLHLGRLARGAGEAPRHTTMGFRWGVCHIAPWLPSQFHLYVCQNAIFCFQFWRTGDAPPPPIQKSEFCGEPKNAKEQPNLFDHSPPESPATPLKPWYARTGPGSLQPHCPQWRLSHMREPSGLRRFLYFWSTPRR